MPFPIAPVVAGGIGALLGGASGGGKGASFSPPTAFMPGYMRTAFERPFLEAMSTPTSIDVSYGGQSLALPRTAPLQAAGLYAGAMSPVQTAPPTPSPLSGALTAMAGMAPWFMGGGNTGLEPIPYNPTTLPGSTGYLPPIIPGLPIFGNWGSSW